MTRYSCLDSLKGLAIIGIFLVHSTSFMEALHISALPLHAERVLIMGKYGVVIFFILSSVTLFKSLDVRSKTENKFIQKFYIRRYFRIAPVYYIVIILAFLLTNGAEAYQNPANLGLHYFDLFLHLTFLNGLYLYTYNSVLGTEWFIFVIICFYLLLPFLYRRFAIKMLVALFFLALVISEFSEKIVGNILVLNASTSTWIYSSPLTWLFVLIGGGILYLSVTYKPRSKLINYISDHENKSWVASVCLLVILAYVRFPWKLYIVVAIGYLWIMLALKKNRLLSIFDNALFRYFGKISYPLYLIHFPLIGYLCGKVKQNPLTGYGLTDYAICTVLTFVFSVIIASLI